MTWAKGRVALLGDSAHNTTPDIGQGGSMAMEDAVVLAMTLQSHELTIEQTLLHYQNKRNERARELVLCARKRCDVIHGADPEATRQWYSELRADTGIMIMEGISRTILTGPLN